MVKSKQDLLTQKTVLTVSEKLQVLKDSTITSGEIRDILIRHLEEEHSGT